MTKIKWYKRDPDSALTGMAQLTLEQRGAYNTIIDLLYSRDGDLPDDSRLLCTHLGCDPRTWRRLRQNLIDAGKLWLNSAGSLTAKRVELELRSARVRIKRASSAAKKRWKNNEGGDAKKKIRALTTTTTTTTRKKDSPPVGPPQGGRPPSKRKALTDQGWKPNAKQHAYALDTLGSEIEVEACVDEFVSYWIGTGKPMADWDMTFHNSVLKFKQRRSNGNGKAPVTGHNRRVINEYLRRSEARERRGEEGYQPDLRLIQGRSETDE